MDVVFKKIDKSSYESLNKQHNIFVLVGNGFDVAVLKKYKSGKLKGKTTSYADFYDYITFYKMVDETNILYKRMTEDKKSGKENWSDFENTLQEMYEAGTFDISALEKSIDEFQDYFTVFLNEMVDSDILLKLNQEAKDKRFSMKSMEHFLSDVSSDEIEFPKKTYHYDLFYFVFANFNYTSLLDNYLFLDKNQFDPHHYRHADRNFNFYIKDSFTVWSSYVLSEVIHPHGTQDIPRSMLFGIDLDKYDPGTSASKRLVKSYWAQYRIKYESYLDEAELFIIYGMSLGKTDSWWMDKIFDAIISRAAELIIYKYGTETEDDIKNLFIAACTRHCGASKDDINCVMKRIYVVTFSDNNTSFLGITE